MAYTAGNLHLRAGAPGDLSYTYDAGSDTLATVAAAGYFNNTDDNLNLTVDDLIWVQAADGNAWFRVSAISSGSVTLQFAGGNLPINTWATSTGAAADQALSVGFYEIGSSISSASTGILPTPYPGAEFIAVKVDSGTAPFTIDAGSGATAVTFDAVGNRRITMNDEGEMIHLVGSSATRWRIYGMSMDASVVNEGGSRFLGGT